MADKHMQILANLIKAVNNVADRRTSHESNSEGSSTATVEETIKRLFPSTEGRSANTTRNTVPEARESRSSEQRNENLDRHPVASIAHFNPSNVYRPKAGKWLLLHDLSELLFLVLLKNQGPFFHQIVEINPVFV